MLPRFRRFFNPIVDRSGGQLSDLRLYTFGQWNVAIRQTVCSLAVKGMVV
jgi:hypothetical protein